jgi:hypothetical protein
MTSAFISSPPGDICKRDAQEYIRTEQVPDDPYTLDVAAFATGGWMKRFKDSRGYAKSNKIGPKGTIQICLATLLHSKTSGKIIGRWYVRNLPRTIQLLYHVFSKTYFLQKKIMQDKVL